MTSSETRRPAGTPAGGQFAPVQHAQSDVELPVVHVSRDYIGWDPEADPETGDERPEWAEHRAWWLENYNRGGTFAFPPKPANATQVIEFWSRTTVPDIILAQFQAAYPAARKRQLDAWTNQAMANDPVPEQGIWGVTKKWKAANDARDARWSEKWRSYTDQVGPPEIPPHEVRSAVLAVMAGRDLKKLPAESDDNSLLTLDEAKDMSLGPCRVGEAERYYCSSVMPASVFRDPGFSASADMAQMRQTMNAMNAELAAIRDGADLDAATQGARTQKEYAQRARAAGFEQRR